MIKRVPPFLKFLESNDPDFGQAIEKGQLGLRLHIKKETDSYE